MSSFRNSVQVYTFHSANVIYFRKTDDKYYLLEKKNNCIISLHSRKCVLSREGVTCFPKQS